MYYYSYTSIWFDGIVQSVVKSGIALEKTQFALILLQEINIDIREFFEKYYEDLHMASSLPLQIFAPIRPPKAFFDDPYSPDCSLENLEERYSFFRDLQKAGISQHDLPKIVFFTLKKLESDDFEFVNIKSLSLREIEYHRSLSYREFFSELINAAHDSYLKSQFDPGKFSKRLSRRFGMTFFEERVRAIPILGSIYKKRIG